ncbi:hypothetical protein XENOCAPTIV_003421, partial [Xenoophorus captivus]
QPQEMRRLYKKKESAGAGLCPPLEEPSAEPGTVPGGTACKRAGRNNGATSSIYGVEKVYLGVRVRMPVRDLLKKIRVPQDMEPDDFNVNPFFQLFESDRVT